MKGGEGEQKGGGTGTHSRESRTPLQGLGSGEHGTPREFILNLEYCFEACGAPSLAEKEEEEEEEGSEAAGCERGCGWVEESSASDAEGLKYWRPPVTSPSVSSSSPPASAGYAEASSRSSWRQAGGGRCPGARVYSRAAARRILQVFQVSTV